MPPPAAAAPPSAAAVSAALGALANLHAVLADRHTPWAAAFKPYDVRGTGCVGLSELLKVFRSCGLSPPPDTLRDLPTIAPSAGGGAAVDYLALGAMVAPAAAAADALPPPLYSATAGAQVNTLPVSRRHAPQSLGASSLSHFT